ncbi:MAG: alpha/beta hydrolase [Candidatus Cryptobacteroides sp.]|nr:alpha/beta hydrolase [Candidatus Cryptobacteroides sp.]
MKKILIFVLALAGAVSAYGQDIKSLAFENGGTGEYKAVMVTDGSLTTHTIFKPQDLSVFDSSNPLPVLVWGNGACTDSPWEHVRFLNEIASHGFIVIAIGTMPDEAGARVRAGMSASSKLTDGINWIIAQNSDPESQYYGKIDVWNIAVAGMSCGGLQTLDVAKDPRIKTIMICNSGLFNQTNAATAVPGMPMPAKERLAEIHTPVIYILGGKTDIAYENGMDDFKRINHVPVFAANYPVGHGGTYGQPYGGEFSVVATAWLQWQLKSDAEAGKLFKGEPCGLSSREGWTAEKKNIP